MQIVTELEATQSRITFNPHVDLNPGDVILSAEEWATWQEAGNALHFLLAVWNSRHPDEPMTEFTAASRALAEEPGAVWGSETPQTNYLQNQDESLRIADELTESLIKTLTSRPFAMKMWAELIVKEAREYRKSRGLEE